MKPVIFSRLMHIGRRYTNNQKGMNKHKIQVSYSDGVRTIVYADIIAVLYERGYTKLAKEITVRANKAFDKREKEIHKKTVWTATTAYDADAAKSLVDKIEIAFKPRPWWKFWSSKNKYKVK